jgi:hypothetical protein
MRVLLPRPPGLHRAQTMCAHRLVANLALPALLVATWSCGGDDLVLPDQPPGTLEVVQGNGQQGSTGVALANPLILRLTDEEGTGIPNRTVVWTASSGSGSINPSTGMTDADGFASAEWTLGPLPGVQRVSAQVPDIGAVTFTARNTDEGPGEEPVAARVEAVEGNGQTAAAGSEVAVRPAVRVLDAEGRPVEGFAVTFVVVGGGGSLGGSTQTTSADGIARVGRWTLGTAPGTNTLEARADSLEGSPVTFTAQGTAPEPGQVVDRLIYPTPPRDAAVHGPIQVEVALVDAEGDVVPLSGIFIYIGLFKEGQDTPSNNLVSGEHFENTQDGIATFDISIEQAGRYRLRALTDDLPELGPHGPEPFLYSEVFEIE